MPLTQTSTTLGAVSSVAAGSWVQLPKSGFKAPIVTVVASAVTTGGTVVVEGREAGSGSDQPSRSAVRDLASFAITANGTSVCPLNLANDTAKLPDEIRINVTARTDGTYTGALLTHT